MFKNSFEFSEKEKDVFLQNFQDKSFISIFDK